MNEELSEFDEQQIRSALHGLEVPRGLSARILERLHHESKSRSTPALGPAELHEPELPPQIGDPPAASPDVSQQHATVTLANPSGASSRFSRRSMAVLALSLSLVGVLFTAYQFSRPLAPERLAEYCLQTVDRLNTVESNWQPPTADELSGLSADLAGQLLSVDIVGVQDISGDPFAPRCRIWALHSHVTHKRLFIFDFQNAKSVQRLSSQMQAISQASGGWSLVAMRSGDRILVVAFEGLWDSYLRRPRSA